MSYSSHSATRVARDRTAVHVSVARTTAFACLAIFVAYLPFSALNGALGAIGAATGADTTDLQWVTGAFTVALAGAVLSGGVLGDRYGRRRVVLVGLGAGALGDVVGFSGGADGGAGAIHALWAGQALAGVGGGLVMSATLALIVAATPDRARRARAIAFWAGATVAALGAGPFLSGVVLEHGEWRWTFVPILALSALALASAVGVRESSAADERRLDWQGQLTASGGIVALVAGVIQAGHGGWGSPVSTAALGVGLALLAVFVAVERRTDAPLLPPRLFASPGFVAAGLAAMAALFSMIGVVFVLGLVFAHAGLSGLGVATRLAFLFGGNAAASVAAPWLQARVGPRLVLVGGLVLMSAGVATVLAVSSGTAIGPFAWRLGAAGAGAGLVMATSTAVAVASVPARFAPLAGAANNALRQVGGALGGAVVGDVFAQRLRGGAGDLQALHSAAAVLVAVLAASAVAAAALLAHHDA